MQWHRAHEESKRVEQIPGIGPITASALLASLGDVKSFHNWRQLAARLGLVPRQHSSGGKPTLLGISKRGDTYLRTLLIHGARAVVQVADRKPEHSPTCRWARKVLRRRNKNIAAVALANKNARIAWALLAHGRQYQSDYVPALSDDEVDQQQGELNHRLRRQSCGDGKTGQERGWSNPICARHLECDLSLKRPTSQTHQGQRQARREVRMYGCNLYLLVVMN